MDNLNGTRVDFNKFEKFIRKLALLGNIEEVNCSIGFLQFSGITAYERLMQREFGWYQISVEYKKEQENLIQAVGFDYEIYAKNGKNYVNVECLID